MCVIGWTPKTPRTTRVRGCRCHAVAKGARLARRDLYAKWFSVADAEALGSVLFGNAAGNGEGS
jgi:hypothetical protein